MREVSAQCAEDHAVERAVRWTPAADSESLPAPGPVTDGGDAEGARQRSGGGERAMAPTMVPVLKPTHALPRAVRGLAGEGRGAEGTGCDRQQQQCPATIRMRTLRQSR